MTLDLFNYAQPGADAATPTSGVILQRLDAEEWRSFMGFVEQVSLPAGALIVRAGDSERSIYVIRSGRVQGEVQAGRRTRATAVMTAGQMFGELAFFDGAPRSASLRALDDVDLLVLPFAAFEKLAAWHPRIARELLLDLGRVLASRLRRAEARG
jgi:CRP/FNR family transcriptional regulator, cyclic AMP receptor protein